MSTTTLCLDIIYLILDFLHADKAALMASSLTCKAWLTGCRYRLFKEITLSPLGVVAFLAYIDSSSSDIASFIGHLIVQRTPILDSFQTMHMDSNSPPKTDHLAIHLRGLKCLTLSDLEWHIVSLKARQLLTGIENVSRLILHRVNFQTIQQSIEYICSFPALEILTLKGWGMHIPNHQMNEFPSTTIPQMKSLRIHISHLNLDQPKSVLYFIQYIMRQDPLPMIYLDTLRLGPLHDLSLLTMPSVRNFLRLSGPVLNQLQIRPPQIPYDATLKDDYLRHFVETVSCKEIRSLSFDLILMSPPPGDGFTPFRIRLISELLRQVTWCRIRQLSFAFVMAVGSHIRLFDWSGVADILAQPHFEDLQRIHITIHLYFERGEEDQRATEAFIRESEFSVFNTRNILDIEFSDEIAGTFY